MSQSEQKNKPLKLHLGCGEKYLKGYVNVDYPPAEHTVMSVKADIYKDITKLEYSEDSVDEVRNHHLFEHFPRAKALRLLVSWRRWLKPGGKIHIETPDFTRSALAYLLTPRQKRKMELGRHIFGSHEADWAYHYDFWDREKFKMVLRKLGFKKIKFRHYHNSFAKYYPKVPLGNLIGALFPESLYKKRGGNKMPNIVVTAIKSDVKIDEEKAVREILNQSLLGKEGEHLLNIWLDQYRNG